MAPGRDAEIAPVLSRYAAPMNSTKDRSTTALVGYAAGMGVVAIALVGVPLQFAYPETAGLWTYALAFAVGGGIGAAVAAIRGT